MHIATNVLTTRLALRNKGEPWSLIIDSFDVVNLFNSVPACKVAELEVERLDKDDSLVSARVLSIDSIR